jgi:Holliday junction resolvase RusA-like endonuclease
MSVLKVIIPGKPRGQGSVTLWSTPGGGERAKYAPDVVNHRNLVIDIMTQEYHGDPISYPVGVKIKAVFARPKTHFGTGANANRLKDSAPHWYTGYPDGDKIARLINDALTIAGVIADDRYVAWHSVEKRWGPKAGTLVEVEVI